MLLLPGMKGRVTSYVLPWVNFSVLPVSLQMQCLFLSIIYRSHHLPIERRNRVIVDAAHIYALQLSQNVSGRVVGMRSSLGKSHSCQGTSATFSPLNHLVPVSSFLDVCLRDVHMSPCLLEFGVWNIQNMVSVPETFLSDTPWSSVLCCSPWPYKHLFTVALHHPLHLCQ